MTKVDTWWDNNNCTDFYQLSDANELFDLGLGQYIMDFTPTTLYPITAPCGRTCTDMQGRQWTNCKGYSSTPGTIKKNKGFIIAFIIVAVAFAAYWYFTKK